MRQSVASLRSSGSRRSCLSLSPTRFRDHQRRHFEHRFKWHQAVLAQGFAALHQVDDDVGQSGQGGQLDRSLNKDRLDVDALRFKVSGGAMRELGGHTQWASAVPRLPSQPGTRRASHHQLAATDSQVDGGVQVEVALQKHIPADDPQVRHAVLNVGGHVVRLEQQEATAPILLAPSADRRRQVSQRRVPRRQSAG